MRYMNGGLNQCEYISITNGDYENILVINDEFENSFFDRLYSCLIKKTPTFEILNTALDVDQFYFDENKDSMDIDKRDEVLEKYKNSRKVYANIKKYLDEPIFLKYQLLETFSNLLTYQQNVENFRKKPKSQLRCVFSLMILNIEYKINFKHEQIKRIQNLLIANESNSDKNFLDLIYQWIEIYADGDQICSDLVKSDNRLEIDCNFMEKFSYEWFGFDSLKLFFKSPRHSAAILTSYLVLLMSKSENFAEILSKKAVINVFVDDQNDVRSTFKENAELATEFYSILLVNVLFNQKFVDKIELPSDQNEFKNKKYTIMKLLLDAKFIDTQENK